MNMNAKALKTAKHDNVWQERSTQVIILKWYFYRGAAEKKALNHKLINNNAVR